MLAGASFDVCALALRDETRMQRSQPWLTSSVTLRNCSWSCEKEAGAWCFSAGMSQSGVSMGQVGPSYNS